ncbi:MAG: response regulator transcription factor [Candidatus Obscuribacterales bacterium]|nr:response regulator transcription factor [Candidatus Obscuribacterales bacterium]
MKARIFLAVNSDLLRIGLVKVLEETGLVIVGSMKEPESFVQNFVAARADVAIVSWRLDGFEHDALIGTTKKRLPQSRFLILLDHPDQFMTALECKADGYNLETISAGLFPVAIAAMREYGGWIGPAVAGHLLHGNQDDSYFRPANHPKMISSLTRKENEILHMMSEGIEIAAIASSLDLSIETVRVHCKHINKKLNVKDRTQAVALLLRGKL